MSDQVLTQNQEIAQESPFGEEPLNFLTTLIEIAVGHVALINLVTGWPEYALWLKVCAGALLPLILVIMGWHYFSLYEHARRYRDRKHSRTTAGL